MAAVIAPDPSDRKTLEADTEARPAMGTIIEDLVLGKQIKTHVHNLRPFIFSPNRVNPVEVAQQNEQEFMVRDIIAHRGDHHRRSSMEFLLRWTGYDESSNSWEPYKALMHVDKLHEYLREHKMRSLIPREHK